MEPDASARDAGSVVSGVVRVKCAEAIRAKVRASSGASSPTTPSRRRVRSEVVVASLDSSPRRAPSLLRRFPEPPFFTPHPLPPPPSPSLLAARLVSVQGRERVTLQKTVYN